jgi:hypothetical protein
VSLSEQLFSIRLFRFVCKGLYYPMISPERTETDYVLVPVPKDRVLDVMAFLTAGHGPQPDRASSDDEPAGDDTRPDPPPWTADALRRLVKEAPSKQVLVLAHLADRAPDWVPAADLRDQIAGELATSYSGRALGAVIKALGQRARYYDGRDRPFEKDWREEIGQMRYRMRAEYAEPVAAAAAERRREEAW